MIFYLISLTFLLVNFLSVNTLHIFFPIKPPKINKDYHKNRLSFFLILLDVLHVYGQIHQRRTKYSHTCNSGNVGNDMFGRAWNGGMSTICQRWSAYHQHPHHNLRQRGNTRMDDGTSSASATTTTSSGFFYFRNTTSTSILPVKSRFSSTFT